MAHWGLQKGLSLKHAPPGRSSRCPPPTLRQPHPRVREAALHGAAGMWGLSGCRAQPGLYACLWPPCGRHPQGGAWEPEQGGGHQPGHHTLIWGHSLSLSGPQGARVCSPNPALYTPDRLWRGGRGPRWDVGEPCFTGPNAGRRQSPVCRQDNQTLLPASTARCPWERRPTTPQAQEDLHVSAGPEPICPGATSPVPG